MHADSRGLGTLTEEYHALVLEATQHGGKVNLGRLRHLLAKDAAWTEDAAEHLLQVATDYGAFFLRNALALAWALAIEDGALKL